LYGRGLWSRNASKAVRNSQINVNLPHYVKAKEEEEEEEGEGEE